MPQMMPINWLLSFFFFILVFSMFYMMNYYIFSIKSNLSLKMKFLPKKNFSWKW